MKGLKLRRTTSRSREITTATKKKVNRQRHSRFKNWTATWSAFRQKKLHFTTKLNFLWVLTVHCVSSDSLQFCHLLSFTDHLLNNNLRRSPHFGKWPSKDLPTYPLEVLDLSSLFYCFNTQKPSLTQHGWAAFSGYAKTPEGKEGEKGKEKAGEVWQMR